MYLHKQINSIEAMPQKAGEGVAMKMLLSPEESPNFAMRNFIIVFYAWFQIVRTALFLLNKALIIALLFIASSHLMAHETNSNKEIEITETSEGEDEDEAKKTFSLSNS